MEDEAIRYQRIKLFLFEKDKYLSFSDLRYKITSNEILILESMITSDFFEGLKSFKRNEYVHFNSFDTAQPIISVPYSEKITIEQCNTKSKQISGRFLTSVFGKTYHMIDFGDAKQVNRTPLCTFELLITIMKNEGKELDKMNIQELLVEKYSEYDKEKVLSILYNEGKQQWVKMIRGGKIQLDEFILSEHYYLTFLDIWMITSLFEIPLIFFGQFKMDVNKKRVFATTKKATHYYLVRLFSSKINTIPKYVLIESPMKDKMIEKKDILMKKEFYTAFPYNESKIKKIDDYIKKYNIR